MREYEAFFAGKIVKRNTTAYNPEGDSNRPSKPYADYPLTSHPCGQWCKKIRGKLYYFGPWNDPDGALKNYRARKDDLHAGRTPRPDTGAATVSPTSSSTFAPSDNAMRAWRQGNATAGPRGTKDQDGNIEAWDEDE